MLSLIEGLLLLDSATCNTRPEAAGVSSALGCRGGGSL